MQRFTQVAQAEVAVLRDQYVVQFHVPVQHVDGVQENEHVQQLHGKGVKRKGGPHAGAGAPGDGQAVGVRVKHAKLSRHTGPQCAVRIQGDVVTQGGWEQCQNGVGHVTGEGGPEAHDARVL